MPDSFSKLNMSYHNDFVEQEKRYLNAAISNVHKWLRKRDQTLKHFIGEKTQPKFQEGIKKLLEEAKHQEERVKDLLTRGQKFLLHSKNQGLDFDLENLSYLLNSYLVCLHNHDDPQVGKIKSETNSQNWTQITVNSKIQVIETVTSDQDLKPFLPRNCYEKLVSVKEKTEGISQLLSSEQFLLDETGSISSGSNCSLDSLNDLYDESFKFDEIGKDVRSSIQLLNEDNQYGKEFSLSSEFAQLSKLSIFLENGGHTTADMGSEVEGETKFLSSLKSSVLSSTAIEPEKMSGKGSVHLGGEDDQVVPSYPTLPDVSGLSETHARPNLAFFDSSSMKISEAAGCDVIDGQQNMHLDISSNTSNISSRSESPLSFTHSRSETPTGTLTRAERQNELWKAIGCIDPFLMDKDIIEACKSSANDLTCSDEDLAGAPNVSFAEFLQQYRELTEWLSQVHKVTQREVTSFSEKYLNQSYHEEMLERSPRREFLNNYSHHVLLRYPNMADQISSKMARLNTQWAAVEQAIVPKNGKHDADTMLQDLECDLNSLRRWLNAIEARLLPLTIKADWTDSEFDERLRQHQVLQRDIESHNKIVNAVLKLSQRLEHHSPAGGGGDSSLQQVALNLERRWHGIWLQSLEWQCRLEGAISRRKGINHSSLDLNIFSLTELDESLFDQSSHDISDQGLIELDDDSLLFIGHRDDLTDSSAGSGDRFFDLTSRRSSSATSESLNNQSLEDLSTDIILEDDLVEAHGSGANTPTGSLSPSRPSGFLKPDSSPLGKRPFPGPRSGEASPAKRGSQSPTSSSGGLSPITQGSPLESFILSRGLHVNSKEGLLINAIHCGDEYTALKSSRLLFDRSSGDSANISETESKMGDSPPANNLLEGAHNRGGRFVAGSDVEGGIRGPIRLSASDVKDIGYSSESQSNDEIEVMGHQIDMEYRFQGKCELAGDGPLGEKITLPSTAVKPHYYSLTIMDVDSTDKTDNGDTTDSGGERMKKMSMVKKNNLHNGFHSGSDRSEKNGGPLSLSGSDKQDSSIDEFMFEFNGDKELDSLNEVWDSDQFPSSINDQIYDEVDNAEHLYSAEHQNGVLPVHTCMAISESDSAPESKDKKSIRYLIEHAEDLVKPSSPQHSIKPGSPKKHQPTLLQPSPSKQTQTDSCSAVESSCDASGEDNSDHEGAPKPSSVMEEFSTATDDADETLFNSVINLESAKHASADDISRPSPHGSPVLDSARLRKQTGGGARLRGKKDRPWSVVGLQEFNNSHKLKSDNHQQIIAASESAIDHLHFSTDTDSPPAFHSQFQSSTFPRESRSERLHRSVSTSEQTSAINSVRRKIKYPGVYNGDLSPKKGERTLLGSPSEETRSVESSSTTKSQLAGYSSGAERSPTKTRRARRLRRRSSLEKKEAIVLALTRSSTTDSYDSAEAESESETTDEYLTAPMEAPTSDGDDVHNISGSLSEHSAWDNFQILYPTASEDPGEELLVWEPQDELEFDDDFQLSKHGRSLVSAVMNNGTKRSKLKFTKQGIPGDESDSDLEDFHHILEQSELQLRLADQSLRKRRKDPMGTGLHPDPAKYAEIIVTYETNILCLNNVCRHLKCDEITEKDCQRVKDIMYQWNKLYSLAMERHVQTTALGQIRNNFADMKVNIKQAESCLPLDRFNSVQGYKETIQLLQEKKQVLQRQGQQLEEIQKSLTDFSALHPIICVDKYLQELVSLQKSTSAVSNKLTEHMNILENNWEVWLEYLDSQQELDKLLASDRERLHALLCQREYGMKVTKKDVLRELEQLQTNLSMYESKLSVLQTMRTRLTKSSDHNSQRLLLAACADLRNQLLVVTERCQQVYRDVEEDEDLPIGHETDLGKLAISAASLHEAFKNRQGQHAKGTLDDDSSSSPTNSCVSRTCASWLRSLPVQLVALMLVAGLGYALGPDILDRLANFALTVEPELHYVNGPPSI